MSGKKTPTVCDECSKEFSSKSNLTTHLATVHTGKRFPCKKCIKSYSTKQKLECHTENAHLHTRYTCIKCSIVYCNKPTLYKHVMRAHDGELLFYGSNGKLNRGKVSWERMSSLQVIAQDLNPQQQQSSPEGEQDSAESPGGGNVDRKRFLEFLMNKKLS